MKYVILLFLFTFYPQTHANVCIEVNIPVSDSYYFDDKIKITSIDGVTIEANLFTPKIDSKKVLPTVIFVNSWILEEHEYTRQAIELVKNGYQVLSYSARGWGCSGGFADIIGPKDLTDLSSVIDWLYVNTNIDKKNLGMAGISYGGGMTLMALAKEPRVKTGFAMSAWGSLSEAMYHQDSPRLFWGSTLMATGFIFGTLDDKLQSNFKKLILNQDTDSVIDWADKRSPIKFVSEINKRNIPVYISNNFGDNLFQPNNVIHFYNKITSPKILDLNQGTHASGEFSGLFTVSNYTFKKMHKWFDYWLQNKTEDSGLNFNHISMQVDLKEKRDIFSIKPNDKKRKRLKYDLTPRNHIMSGGLTEIKNGKKTIPTKNIIFSHLDTLASTGVPILSAIVDGHFKLPVYSYMPFIDPMHGIKFSSKTLKKTMKIRGIPKLNISLDSNSAPYQIITYLYDVNKYGLARLITHGVYSGEKINGSIDMEIVATAYDIPKGNHLTLIIDTKDILYAPKSLMPFKLDINFFGSSVNSLKLPIL